jgi:hypothetical protein
VLENVFGTIGIRGHKRFAHSSVKFLFSGGEGGPFNWREHDDPDVLRAQVIQEVTAEGEQLARVGDGRGFKILELESHKDLGTKFVVGRVRESGLQVIRRLGAG